MKKIFPDHKGIYIILNAIKNKCYIGESDNIHRRLKSHKLNLEKGTHTHEEMQKDFNNGDPFYYLIVDLLPNELDRVHMMAAETYYMIKYDSLEHGYNKGYPIPPTDNRYLKLLESKELYRFLQKPNP